MKGLLAASIGPAATNDGQQIRLSHQAQNRLEVRFFPVIRCGLLRRPHPCSLYLLRAQAMTLANPFEFFPDTGRFPHSAGKGASAGPVICCSLTIFSASSLLNPEMVAAANTKFSTESVCGLSGRRDRALS